MSTDLQNIALESLDGTLVAQNENGHLTYPMLHLDSDSVPENAQGWAPLMQGYESVLVFVEGKVHFTDEDKIAPTTLVLCEENNFSQTINIQTEREWSITRMNDSLIRVDPMAGVGNSQLTVTKAPAFSESGFYFSSFTITIAGVSETGIQVYLFMGSPIESNMITIDLTEDNDYIQPLDVAAAASWKTVGVSSAQIQVSQSSGNGDIQIEVSKVSSCTTSGTTVFAITGAVSTDAVSTGAVTDDLIAVVVVRMTVTKPLTVEYKPALPTITATHGETLTVTLTEVSGYAAQTLTIIRDGEWKMYKDSTFETEGVDTTKIAVSAMSGTGTSPTYSLTTTISKAPSFNPGFESTAFWIVSKTQWVKIEVNFTPPITGEFVDPQTSEEGVTNPVYIYI